jgi:predicted phage terminase large subunit-like protein
MDGTYRRTKREIDYLLLHQELLSASEKQELVETLRAMELDLARRNRDAEKQRLLSDYYYFLQQAWPWIENVQLVTNWHIELMCRYLQALQARKPFRDLIINVPPGCSKSSNTMVFWPAWVFAKNPCERILCASYDDKLVKKQSVDSRRLMDSEWYQSFFGDEVQVRPDVDTQVYFETTAGGSRFVTTPRGRATGRHPTIIACFPGGTSIETNAGPVAIERLVQFPSSFRVLGHSGAYRRIVRGFHTSTDSLVEIVHGGGLLRCTPTHPVWIDSKGWIDAKDVSAGDHLVRVDDSLSEVTCVSDHQVRCDVFNLEVEIDNTYYADGVLVHNCDDLANPKQSQSTAERESLIEWWDGTMETRGAAAEMNRARVVIAQRLHQKDIPGHIMDADVEHEWARLILPMRWEPDRMPDIGLGTDPRTEEGELLDPVRFPEATVAKTERTLGIYQAAGQLAQRPTPKESAKFKLDEIHIVPLESVPLNRIIRWKRFWDKAATKEKPGKKNKSDYTAGALGGITGGEFPRMFVVDMVHGRFSSDEVEKQIGLWARLDEARFGFSKMETVFEEEGGASGIQAAAETKRRLRKHRVRSIRPTVNKEVRAEPLANAIAAGEVYFVEAPWVHQTIDEMRNFPKGEHDDRVDALSGLRAALVGGSMFEEASGDDEEQALRPCANPACDRTASADTDHCCDSCREAEHFGTKLGESGHCPECAYRHSQLYASGEWEPNAEI